MQVTTIETTFAGDDTSSLEAAQRRFTDADAALTEAQRRMTILSENLLRDRVSSALHSWSCDCVRWVDASTVYDSVWPP